ncbi:MAG: hypothetical protein JST04_12920 [Bdellovibrionales bacterium]|nr:hypothetical protein [Bdellovibrionales bacterium]
MNARGRLSLRTQFTDRTVLVDGQPPFLRRPDFWAKALSEWMDLLVFFALYATNEVQTWPFVVAVGLSAIRAITRFRLSTFWMVTGFLLLLFLGVQLVFRVPLHPIVASAHVAPLAMAWIGLARGSEDFWGWRMGLGFVGLILASALTPDFSVMLMILAFIISGSIALACRYLANEFIRRGVLGTLPAGFIRSSFYQSGILLLSALFIFPLIPRVQGRGGGMSGDAAKTGYTEEVNLSEWSRVSSQGSSTPALRIYGTNGVDPTTLIPAGLLRSRVLSVLSANQWNPTPVKTSVVPPNPKRATAPRLTIVREMIGPANLPVPYGTDEVLVELSGYKWPAERTQAAEWRENRSRNQRFNYTLTLDTDQTRAPQDEPSAIELAVPENFRSSRLKNLANRLFQGVKTADAKIAAIQSYFQAERFKPSYAEDDASAKSEIDDRKLPPIERFLFIEKAGHCELFASSMAILLRMGGVPTRLIAGFRVSRNAFGDVLTVRQSDAHAWVEVFVPKRGWIPVDPTPKILQFTTITDWVRDTYDWASAKWSQYILNYGDDENSLAAQWEKVKRISAQIANGKNPFKSADTDANLYLFTVLFISSVVLFSFTTIFVLRRAARRKTKYRPAKSQRDLARERYRMDRVCARLAAKTSEKRILEAAVRAWFANYERARFGSKNELEKGVVVDLRRSREAIEASLKEIA